MKHNIQGGAGKLHVEESGSGQPAILFLPSSAGTTRHWKHQIETLGKEFRVVAPDPRGHGQSDAPANGDYAVESLADDVKRVIKTLQLAPCVLVGHSTGGVVALHYAAQHPDQVAGLFLLDPGNDSRHLTQTQKQQAIEAMQHNYQPTVEAYWKTMIAGDEGISEQLFSDLHAANPDAMRGEMEALFDYDPLPALNALQMPAFALVAEPLVTPASLHVLHPTLPHHLVPDTGHWIQLSHPQLVTQAIRQFIQQLKENT